MSSEKTSTRKRKYSSNEQKSNKKVTDEDQILVQDVDKAIPTDLLEYKIGPMLSESALTSQCAMATESGSRCVNETVVRVGGEARTIDCQQYCWEHWNAWISSIFFKIPTTVIWKDPNTKIAYNFDVRNISIEFLVNTERLLDREPESFDFTWNAQDKWKIEYNKFNNYAFTGDKNDPLYKKQQPLNPAYLKRFQQWFAQMEQQKHSVHMRIDISAVPATDPQLILDLHVRGGKDGSAKDDIQVLFGTKTFLPFDNHQGVYDRINKDVRFWYWMLRTHPPVKLSVWKTIDFNFESEQSESVQGGKDIIKSPNWKTGIRGGKYYIDSRSGRKIYKRK